MCLTTFGYIALAQAATSAQDIVLRKSISDRDGGLYRVAHVPTKCRLLLGFGESRRQGEPGQAQLNCFCTVLGLRNALWKFGEKETKCAGKCLWC